MPEESYLTITLLAIPESELQNKGYDLPE